MKIFIIITIIAFVCSRVSIDQFGAISAKDTVEAQQANVIAFNKALQYINSTDLEQKTIVIPNKKYYFLPILIQNINNLTIIIEGKVIASKNVRAWALKPGTKDFYSFITFVFCDNLTIRGGGKVDGRGYHWWILTLLNDKKLLDHQGARPHLFQMIYCRNTIMHDLILKNSPQFHIKMDDCQTAQIYNLNIKVNTTAQFNLLKRFSIEGIIPMFPFNTDGIDPHGTNMHIYNLTVQNWDDVVVPKPGNQDDRYGTCTQNFLVQDINVVLGVGMSIGSISPNPKVNCIKNVTFQNIKMVHPLKGIYIKTNPGNQGHSIVSNIVYQNFTMDTPIWWAIYIGPQQMKQPDGDGPGCMIYPFDPNGKCTTQPLVTIQNITLKNIDIHNSVLYPVTIRCNVSNPCRNFVFDNVRTDHWHVGQKQTGVVCEYATGIQINNRPNIYCFYDGQTQIYEQPQQKIKVRQQFITARRIWKELEQAVRMHPYQQQNDQMDENYLDYI